MPPASNTSAGTVLPRSFRRYRTVIGAALRDEMTGRDLPLYTTLRYYLGWVDPTGKPEPQPAGKALRPTLCLLACEAAGGDPAQALPAAVALEFVHNFSLIHDDIEDGDRTRRHRPTVWAIWGEAVGIASGNAIFSLADIAMQKLLKRGVPEDTALEAGRQLAAHYLRMMEGQYLDIAFEKRANVSVEEYLDMIRRKTGALIECSAYIGSLIGSDTSGRRNAVAALRAVGRGLGYAFQIRDDVLGVWGGPETGKPVGADIRRKKKALPAVHALSTATGAAAAALAKIYAQDQIENEDMARVLQIMDDLESRSFCENLAARHWRRAETVLKSIQLAGETKKDFEELGEFLLVRQS